jgi:putative secretion ATPase (PEP-CTERM system associated)
MYEKFYDLRERPFALSPDPSYLYHSRAHGETLSYIRYGIEGHAAFVVITGEVGSGKTTLLQTALRSLDQQTSVSRLMSTMLDAQELLEAVMLDFGLDPPPGASKPRLLRELAGFLVNQRTAGHLALLVIDEAQNLTLSALEEVRMLSNFETERSKLMQIVLVGQPSLRDTLARPELEQLRQRITVSYHLRALDQVETIGYIHHRLARAAAGVPLEFPVDVAELVYRHSRGVPRTINVICDAVLMYGYGEDRRQITVDLAGRAIADLIDNRVLSPLTDVQTPAVGATPDSDLLAREIRVQQRERQLVEQQRVLDEQYRRLAASEIPSLPVARAAAPPRTAPSSPAAPSRPAPPSPAAPGSRPARPAQPAADIRPSRVPPPETAIRPSQIARPAGAPRVPADARRLAPLRTAPMSKYLLPPEPVRSVSVETSGIWARLRRNLLGDF